MRTSDGDYVAKAATRPLVLSVLLGVLGWSASGVLLAQTRTTVLSFEDEGLDLHTGEVIDRSDLAADQSPIDFHLAFHADRTPHAVLVQASGGEVAWMSDTPFEEVTASDIPGLAFTSDLIDEPCGGGDTVVLRVSDGSVYKIGKFLEDPATGVVVFDYELLQSWQALRSPQPPDASVRVAARPGTPDSVFAQAGCGEGPESPPPGLSAEAYRSIRRHVERELYGIRRPADAVDAGVLESRNPAQAYRTRFTPDGIRVRPRGTDLELGLTLIGWGYGELVAPVEGVAPRVEGERVDYVRGPLTEWYVNRSCGLEQGFTVSSPPEGGRGAERLRLVMSVSGPLTAGAEGRSILFRDASGTTRLRYGGLKAWDAAGRELVAEMKLADNRLTLEVDDSRAVFPLTVDPTIVNESAKLVASDAAVLDALGSSVALSGDTVVVAVSGNDDQGTDSGSAYVFERPAPGWAGTLTEAAKLLPSDGAAKDNFGSEVAVSGGTVVASSPQDDDNGFNSGSAYVFERPAAGWAGTLNEVAKLLPSDGAPNDLLTSSVAISGDIVVVGARFDDDNGLNSGSAYVFEKPALGWTGTLSEAAKLLASDGAAIDFFGRSVAVAGDTVVVAAWLDDDQGGGSGSAYVFEKPTLGWAGTLTEAAKLLPSDGEAGDLFGSEVAVWDDTVVVGAENADDLAPDSGSAYVFEKPALGWAGTLSEAAKLQASDGYWIDEFGSSVAVSGDTAVVGASRGSGQDFRSGSAYVFKKPALGWAGTVNEDAELVASDGAFGDRFGWSVGVSGDTVVVGAFADDDGGVTSGSAYIFSLGPPDADGDGVPDDLDNCPADANPLQSNIDGDAPGDLCDLCPADPEDLCDPDGSTAEEISAAGGGQLQTPDGMLTIDMDPGDLAADNTISVTRTVVTDPEVNLTIGPNPGLGQAVAVYELQPSGLVFANPVTLTIIVDVTSLNQNQRDRLDVYVFSDTDGDSVPDSFVAVGADCTVTGDLATCSAEVDHFSVWGLLAPLDSDGDGLPDLFDGLVDVCPSGPNIVNGLLAPLAALVSEEEAEVPMTDTAFKQGTTLPLRLDYLCGTVPLTDAAGVAPPQIVGLERTGEPVALETIDPDAGAANDNSLLFRFSDEHWIHNFATADLETGTYVITLTLPDGRRSKTGFVLR